MRLLLNDIDPTVTALGTADDGEALARLYAYPARNGRPWVRANMVATLDGAAAGHDGKSGSINTTADREVFTLLRALADVIVVGAGTARAEAYRRPRVRQAHRTTVRAGRPPHPALAVVTRTAHLPPLLAADDPAAGPVLMVTCSHAGAPAIEAARHTLGSEQVIVAGESTVELSVAVRELHRRGLARVLCEGGPHLLRDAIDAGLLDELCLTVTPLLVAGDQPRIAVGADVAQSFTLRLLIESQGTLLNRWVRSTTA
ncbi:pyrimidine reductase family protein [Salinactinospora qingdaonensis]|uniref:Pyrimidine reductase family protein n=1 Tax=Salinactinospora qingdaonensis TaxID=702744 RepID=A0ABP7FRP8_9ACTN